MFRFLTHPEVRIDGEIPVPLWGLSDVGRARASLIPQLPWISNTTRLVSSAETKAIETAAIVACTTGLPIEVREQLHENDRSATGFVPPLRFEELADAFFAHPTDSIEGWETARAAQQRVCRATADLLTADLLTVDEDERRAEGEGVIAGDTLVIAHGAVGTLLLCDLLGIAIGRTHDQIGNGAAPGGGNYWAFDRQTRSVLHRWQAIESPN